MPASADSARLESWSSGPATLRVKVTGSWLESVVVGDGLISPRHHEIILGSETFTTNMSLGVSHHNKICPKVWFVKFLNHNLGITFFLSCFRVWRRPILITGLRPNVNTLTLLVPTSSSIDYFIFRTLVGASKITQCRTPAQSFWKSKMVILDIQRKLIERNPPPGGVSYLLCSLIKNRE